MEASSNYFKQVQQIGLILLSVLCTAIENSIHHIGLDILKVLRDERASEKAFPRGIKSNSSVPQLFIIG